MKKILILIFININFGAQAQKTETYYDFYWKETSIENARFYSTLEKTDSGWFRNDYFIGTRSLQMQALYEDKQCKIQNGSSKYFYANGYPSTIGRMIHNKKEGVCISYHSNGMIADSALYRNGVVVGGRLLWHRNGSLSDSIYHANDSMDVQLSWFEDGGIASAGYLMEGKEHGKWKFYHRNGSIAAEEIYSKGKAISKTYYNEDGTLQTDTSKANSYPVFKKKGKQGWMDYMESKLYWPVGYELKNTTTVTVGIGFIVDEEGKVTDVEVYTPFNKKMDAIAVSIIRNSPGWTSGMSHNRKIKFKMRQPVTFVQQ